MLHSSRERQKIKNKDSKNKVLKRERNRAIGKRVNDYIWGSLRRGSQDIRVRRNLSSDESK